MDSQIEQIKNKLNVIDVIGSYLKLTKTGINYRGVCPFHSEKKPSFFVSPSRQMWHCFGCGAGSSIFDFVMKIEGVEFGDALRILAHKAGIELKQENPQLRTERQRLYEICELACTFFEKQLAQSSVGKEAGAYLQKRGIFEESIKKWRIGYSPDTWQGLSDFLVSKGYTRKEIIKAGLAIPKENSSGDSYDRFRGRIIFPVFDLNSQIIGFGGRVFKQGSDQEIAKYINTPKTLLYDKGSTLYGLHDAKLAARKQNQCVVTEGYTDVIMCHQAGFENTVAASGTALTSQHLHILKRYSENLVLAFDMDVAGDSATKRGITLAQELGFNIKIIESYLKNSDPADIVSNDPKLWQEALLRSRSIMEYYFDSALLKFDKNSPEGKKEIGKIVLPAIKRISNKIEQSYWIQKLSEVLNTREEIIMAELAKTVVDKNKEIHQPLLEKSKEGNRKNIIEEKVISLVIKDPEYVKLIKEDQYDFFSPSLQQFLKEVKNIVENHVVPEEALEKDLKTTLHEKISILQENALWKNFLAALILRADIDYQEDNQEEFLRCLFELKNIELKNKLMNLSEEIKKAEVAKESETAKSLIEKFNNLAKELT